MAIQYHDIHIYVVNYMLVSKAHFCCALFSYVFYISSRAAYWRLISYFLLSSKRAHAERSIVATNKVGAELAVDA